MAGKKGRKRERNGGAVVKNILSPGTHFSDRFIPDYRELKRVIEDLKRMGYRIVLTQGVYDMIHEGHALYLEQALEQGDILVVGVDSDELTRARKGPGRPIVPQDERLRMLAHLRHVHILTLKNLKDGLAKLIEVVRPDVFVTSESTSDFGKKEIQRYKSICGKIITLPPQATTSTTGRVRFLTIQGADKLAQEVMRGVPKLIADALDKLKG